MEDIARPSIPTCFQSSREATVKLFSDSDIKNTPGSSLRILIETRPFKAHANEVFNHITKHYQARYRRLYLFAQR
jgi:hypothetical protein